MRVNNWFRICEEAADAGGEAGGGGAEGEGGEAEAEAAPAGLMSQGEGQEPTEKPTDIEHPWELAKGVRGEGERPDFFKHDKYATIADQAKAYTELESRQGKFGTLFGAPDATDDNPTGYDIKLPQSVPGEIDKTDPQLQGFLKVSHDMGLSQEAVQRLYDVYAESSYQADRVSVENEVALLGDKAPQRISMLDQQLRNQLPEELYDAIMPIMQTAGVFGAIEHLVNGGKPPNMPVGTDVAPAVTRADIDARVADERYQREPAFRAETERMFLQLYGDAPVARTI